MNVTGSPLLTGVGGSGLIRVLVSDRSTCVVTVRGLLAGAVFEPAFVVVTPPAGMVLVTVPGVVEVTTTVTSQLPFAGIVPFARLTLVVVWLAVPPTQVVAAAPIVVTPAGKLSVKATPVMSKLLGLVTVIVKVEFAPDGMVAGLNCFARVGGWKTVKVEVAGVAFEPPFVVVTPPAGMVLGYTPLAAEVTGTTTSQLPFAGIVAPAKLTLVAVWLAVPGTHVVVAAPAVVTPAGKLSVNAVPVSGTALLLLTVMVSVEVPLMGIDAGLNCLATVGGWVPTVRVAVVGFRLGPPLVLVTPPAGMVLV
jgi:hypothetical protein